MKKDNTPYIQHDLTIEEQKEAQSYYILISLLLSFQNNATPNLFKWLWGEQGPHLWEVFVYKAKRDIMNFLTLTSSDVRITLVCNLVKESNTETIYINR